MSGQVCTLAMFSDKHTSTSTQEKAQAHKQAKEVPERIKNLAGWMHNACALHTRQAGLHYLDPLVRREEKKW